MRKLLKILTFVMLFAVTGLKAQHETHAPGTTHGHEETELNVKEFILHHLADAYEFHLTEWDGVNVSVPLPVILYSQHEGWRVFMSSVFHHETVHDGFTIAHEGEYMGKIVEIHSDGSISRPLDLSITKVVFSLLFNSILIILLIMSVAGRYKKGGFAPKKGLTGFMEIFIMDLNDNLIKPCVGPGYRKFAPYLLTVFFFIFINNLMGLIPLFPGGASVTGNIAVTFVLAVFTFVIVQFSSNREYWKEIFWPEVPVLLKVPVPLMPVIEIVGIFTKPFALMIRLFANMLAGHAILLGLASLIFVTIKLGVAMHSTMTGVSILLSIFIDFLEILVAYIQAYVFTLLSAVFIGLAKPAPHHNKH